MAETHPLRAYREAQNPPLSQEELARILGVNRVTVTRWEGRQRQIDSQHAELIYHRLGIGPAAIRPDWAKLFRKSWAKILRKPSEQQEAA